MSGGRPRDPHVDEHIRTAVVRILADEGMAMLTAEHVAALAHCGKAAIYRRWRTQAAMLADVVENQLGIQPFDYADGPGTDRDDLVRLLSEAVTGTRARAEAAVLSAVGHDEQLRHAYARGPVLRFFRAMDAAKTRARRRGTWSAWWDDPVHLAWTSLMYRTATGSEPPSLALIEDVVDRVVIPATQPIAVAS